MLKTLVLHILFLSIYGLFQLSGQEKSNPLKEIKTCFLEAASEKSYFVSSETVKEISTDKFLKTIAPYLNDPKPFVRYKAIDLTKRKGLLLSDTPERQKITPLLIEACKDKDSGNSGAASNALTLFTKSDFTAQAADSILALLASRPYHFERVIKLAGFVPNQKTVEKLSEMLSNDTTLNKKEKWALTLALARNGDATAIDYCMEKISGAGVNDEAITYLFPDLAYIRQPQAINYMLQGILTDEKNCRSSNPDSEKEIVCAFKIMELVAPVVTDFPVKLTSYGELNTDNYDTSLSATRGWINRNKSD